MLPVTWLSLTNKSALFLMMELSNTKIWLWLWLQIRFGLNLTAGSIKYLIVRQTSLYNNIIGFSPNLVASHEYVTEAHNVYVINGNSALLKCQIPSFVADFVQVDSWVDDKGNQFVVDARDFGNFKPDLIGPVPDPIEIL